MPLIPGKNKFTPEIETHFFAGNRLWLKPDEAVEQGKLVGQLLLERHGGDICAVFVSAVDVFDYAAIPAQRRANLMHGVVDAIAEIRGFGGEEDWSTQENSQGENDV